MAARQQHLRAQSMFAPQPHPERPAPRTSVGALQHLRDTVADRLRQPPPESRLPAVLTGSGLASGTATATTTAAAAPASPVACSGDVQAETDVAAGRQIVHSAQLGAVAPQPQRSVLSLGVRGHTTKPETGGQDTGKQTAWGRAASVDDDDGAPRPLALPLSHLHEPLPTNQAAAEASSEAWSRVPTTDTPGVHTHPPSSAKEASIRSAQPVASDEGGTAGGEGGVRDAKVTSPVPESQTADDVTAAVPATATAPPPPTSSRGKKKPRKKRGGRRRGRQHHKRLLSQGSARSSRPTTRGTTASTRPGTTRRAPSPRLTLEHLLSSPRPSSSPDGAWSSPVRMESSRFTLPSATSQRLPSFRGTAGAIRDVPAATVGEDDTPGVGSGNHAARVGGASDAAGSVDITPWGGSAPAAHPFAATALQQAHEKGSMRNAFDGFAPVDRVSQRLSATAAAHALTNACLYPATDAARAASSSSSSSSSKPHSGRRGKRFFAALQGCDEDAGASFSAVAAPLQPLLSGSEDHAWLSAATGHAWAKAREDAGNRVWRAVFQRARVPFMDGPPPANTMPLPRPPRATITQEGEGGGVPETQSEGSMMGPGVGAATTSDTPQDDPGRTGADQPQRQRQQRQQGPSVSDGSVSDGEGRGATSVQPPSALHAQRQRHIEAQRQLKASIRNRIDARLAAEDAARAQTAGAGGRWRGHGRGRGRRHRWSVVQSSGGRRRSVSGSGSGSAARGARIAGGIESMPTDASWRTRLGLMTTDVGPPLADSASGSASASVVPAQQPQPPPTKRSGSRRVSTARSRRTSFTTGVIPQPRGAGGASGGGAGAPAPSQQPQAPPPPASPLRTCETRPGTAHRSSWDGAASILPHEPMPAPTFAFPSQKPATRSDAVYLTRVLDDMQAELISLFESGEGQAGRLQVVGEGEEVAGFHPKIQAELSMWTLVTSELVRQVWLHCEERGKVLDRARLRLLALCHQAHQWCAVQTIARREAVVAAEEAVARMRKELDGELQVLGSAYKEMVGQADALKARRKALDERYVHLVSPHVAVTSVSHPQLSHVCDPTVDAALAVVVCLRVCRWIPFFLFGFWVPIPGKRISLDATWR